MKIELTIEEVDELIDTLNKKSSRDLDHYTTMNLYGNLTEAEFELGKRHCNFLNEISKKIESQRI